MTLGTAAATSETARVSDDCDTSATAEVSALALSVAVNGTSSMQPDMAAVASRKVSEGYFKAELLSSGSSMGCMWPRTHVRRRAATRMDGRTSFELRRSGRHERLDGVAMDAAWPGREESVAKPSRLCTAAGRDSQAQRQELTFFGEQSARVVTTVLLEVARGSTCLAGGKRLTGIADQGTFGRFRCRSLRGFVGRRRYLSGWPLCGFRGDFRDL